MQSKTSAVVRLEGEFQIEYQKTWHVPVIMNYGRDRKALRELIDQLGEGNEERGEQIVRGLIRKFFDAVRPIHEGGDPVVSRSRYSNISDFRYHAQYLLLKEQRGATNAMPQKSVETLSAIASAMGRKKDR